MKIVGMIQARMGSSRLPGKVLEKIHKGRSILEIILDRLSHCKCLTEIAVLTTVEPEDVPIVKLCRTSGVFVLTGSVHDVLDRFYQGAKALEPDHIVRITADCPLLDPQFVDKLIRLHLKNYNDYTSNTLKETWPDGLDAEVFTMDALETAWKNAKKPSEREHVTPYIKNNPERFQLENLESGEDLSHMRWTVDKSEDLKLIRQIYKGLEDKINSFGYIRTSDVLQFLRDNPELEKINSSILRNEGYLYSLEKERYE